MINPISASTIPSYTRPTSPDEKNQRGDTEAAATAVRPESAPKATSTAESSGTDKTKEASKTGECETCKNRKYQDGSDDPGVSFKSATKVAPQAAASAVARHEGEHVSRERSKADSEGREVVFQSVRYSSAICPDCGKVYISGGETVTATRAKPKNPQAGVGEALDAYA